MMQDRRGDSRALSLPPRGPLDRLVALGTGPDLDARDIQRVRLVNQVAIFVVALLVRYLFVFLWRGARFEIGVQIAGILGLCSALFFNARRRFRAARIVTLLTGNSLVAVMTVVLGRASGLGMYAFAAIVAPLIFYPRREWRIIAAWAWLTVSSSVIADEWLEVHPPYNPLPAAVERWFHTGCLVGGLVTVFAFVLYLYIESRRFEDGLLAANAVMTRMAETDVLTGVANRRKVEATLQREWGRAIRGRYPLSVVLVDVDHFKAYNDRHGHAEGDAALVAVAGGLQEGARRVYDLVGRYGGEEFLVVLPHSDATGAMAAAERARLAVLALALEHGASSTGPVVSCSFGAASCQPQPGTDPFALVREADAALYRAKADGRNRVVTGGAERG